MNLFHGSVIGCYITLLACRVPKENRGFCFGTGYAVGNVTAWLLFMMGDILPMAALWLIFAILAALSGWLFLRIESTAEEAAPGQRPMPKDTAPGLVLALVSLCFPLLSISLYQLSGFLAFLAITGYAVTGFHSVFRVVVFADFCDDNSNVLFLAPVGLLCGMAGQGAGAVLGHFIGSRHVVLTALTVILFASVMILAFLLYVRLYGAKQPAAPEDRAVRLFRSFPG